MFETSVVRARATAVRSRVSVLSASLVAHSMVVIGVVAAGIASTDFPVTAPDQMGLAPPIGIVPPPLGTPDGGSRPKPAPEAPKPAITPPPVTRDAAPSVAPEVAAPVEDPVPSGSADGDATADGDADADGPATGSGSGPLGVPWGVKGSVGDLDAPPVAMATRPVEDKVYAVGGDVTAPVLIHRVEPVYPNVLLHRRLGATVVVRCVIGRDGRVRNPEIVVGSLPPFNDAVIRAVTQWRFTPGTFRGKRVDTYLDLSVNFDIR